MEDIHDIKGPMAIVFNYVPLIVVFSILLILLALLLYLNLRKKKHVQQKEDEPVIKVSPRDIALVEIEKLRNDKLIEFNKCELFYNKLTEILRKYIREQYAVNIESKTSTEAITDIKRARLNPDFTKHFELCLKNLDFAKYSSYKISSEDMLKSLDMVRTLLILESKIQTDSR